MKITSDKILFFDLDGTLIDTDYANWISYKEAINEFFGENSFRKEYNPIENRFDNSKLSAIIHKIYNERNDGKIHYGVRNYIETEKKIISKKQEFYSKNIEFTKKIEENILIWERFIKTNKIILVSNSKKKRGVETIKHHKLYFYRTFFLEDKTLSENKYENAIKTLEINPQNIIAFEDNEEEIQKAKEAGVQHINIKVEGKNIKEVFGGVFKYSTDKTLIYQNDKNKLRVEIDNNIIRSILENKENYKLYAEEEQYPFPKKEGKTYQEIGKKYKILKDGIKEFTIEPNNFLKQEIKAFYHKDYFGSGNWNIEGKIEHLIWSIKNDDGCKSSHKLYLSTACKRLKNILFRDLSEIKDKIKVDGLTVCVVPRAEEGFVYRKDQLLFRQIISNVVNKLNGLENGTKYIVRHTTTATTHLGKYDKGKRPYVGITKDTCYISDNVIGKNILLIDDVYTKGVGIDEDAIQALLDKGASNVWFYSIGKTYSYK